MICPPQTSTPSRSTNSLVRSGMVAGMTRLAGSAGSNRGTAADMVPGALTSQPIDASSSGNESSRPWLDQS